MQALTLTVLCHYIFVPAFVRAAERDPGWRALQQEKYDKIYSKSEPQAEWGMSYNWNFSEGMGEPLDKVLPRYLKATDRIMILGGGLSQLGSGLWQDGFKDITQIDVSEVAVSKMKADFASFDGLKFAVQDATDMVDYGTNTFDVVIEKLTFDFLSFYGTDVTRASQEALRILKHDGVLLSVTNHGKVGATGKPSVVTPQVQKVFGKDNCHWDDKIGSPEGSRLSLHWCKAAKVDRTDL